MSVEDFGPNGVHFIVGLELLLVEVLQKMTKNHPTSE
jgi:hypothetical protein